MQPFAWTFGTFRTSTIFRFWIEAGLTLFFHHVDVSDDCPKEGSLVRIVGHAVGHKIGKLLAVWCGQVTLSCIKPLLLLSVRNKIKQSQCTIGIGLKVAWVYSYLFIHMCVCVYVCLPQWVSCLSKEFLRYSISPTELCQSPTYLLLRSGWPYLAHTQARSMESGPHTLNKHKHAQFAYRKQLVTIEPQIKWLPHCKTALQLKK